MSIYESRISSKVGGKSAPLPVDYLKMVQEVFTAHFDATLKRLSTRTKTARFEANGRVFPNEVVISVTLVYGNDLECTTVHASQEFDPKASAPTVQDILATNVDVLGGFLHDSLEAPDEAKDSDAEKIALEKLEQFCGPSLSSLEDVPYDWTVIPAEKAKVYIKVDKTNPRLDDLATEWLEKHDPRTQAEIDAELAETESLFVTGEEQKKRARNSTGSGTIH